MRYPHGFFDRLPSVRSLAMKPGGRKRCLDSRSFHDHVLKDPPAAVHCVCDVGAQLSCFFLQEGLFVVGML